MPLEKDFLDCAPQTVTVTSQTTDFTVYGAPSFSTGVNYSARVEKRNRITVGPDNRELTSSTQIFVMSSSASIAVNDKLTLADGSSPEILSVNTVDDDKGQHHVEVMCR